MGELTPERISAYHDRELAPAEAARLRARLSEEAEARAVLEAFGRVDDEARAAFEAELDEPVPLALARTVRQGFAARRRRALARTALRWAGPVAAAIAILVGGQQWLEHRVERSLAQREARLAELTDQAVQEALETALSGVAVARADEALGTTVSVTPIRTYKSESEHWCREFVEQVSIDGEQVTRYGLACREKSGGWERVQTRLPGSNPPPVGQAL
jgi:surface antigen